MKADNNSKMVKEWTERSKAFIDILHNIQIRRIELGFSHADLSFLLGKPINYVYNIETFLNDKEYYLSDLVRLYDIYNCTPKDLFAKEDELEPNYRCEAGVYQYWDNNATKHHEIYENRDFKSRLVYKTSEHIPRVERLKELKTNLVAEIHILIIESYFNEGAEAMFIFNTCRNRVKNNFRPIHLKAVLQYFVETVDPPLLEIDKVEDRFVYVLSGSKKTQLI